MNRDQKRAELLREYEAQKQIVKRATLELARNFPRLDAVAVDSAKAFIETETKTLAKLERRVNGGAGGPRRSIRRSSCFK